MKVLLLFPPSWHPSQPYLSLPSLTAFLRQNGVPNVVQRDINIELLDILLTEKTCLAFYQKILDKLKQIERSAPSRHATSSDQERRQALIHAVEALPFLAKKVERAKQTLRSEGCGIL